jgi:hypothetical protein
MRRKRTKKTILLISCTTDLLDSMGDFNEIEVYNKSKLFLDTFIKDVKDQFEDFKPIHV